MTHFRQERVIDYHFAQEEGEAFTHTFKGKEYEITPENYKSLKSDLIQSVSTRLAKKYGSSYKTTISSGKSKGEVETNEEGEGEYEFDEAGPNKAQGRDTKQKSGVTSDLLIVRNELKRLSLSEKIVEEKLNYPKVFERLLSQPHLALDERKKSVEDHHELYIFVDTAASYMRGHHELHNAIITEGSKLKGVKVFHGTMVRNLMLAPQNSPATHKESSVYYWSVLKHLVPKGRRVLVFTQGCGGVNGRYPKEMGYKLNFCTPFAHGSTCGCNTIPEHFELSKKDKLVRMNYGIFKAKDLRKIELF